MAGLQTVVVGRGFRCSPFMRYGVSPIAAFSYDAVRTRPPRRQLLRLPDLHRVLFQPDTIPWLIGVLDDMLVVSKFVSGVSVDTGGVQLLI